MYKFLLKPNWLAAHLLVICLALFFSSLGFWQLNRLNQIKKYNKELIVKMKQNPKSLAELANIYNFKSDIEQLNYLPVKIFGRFDPSYEVLLRGRSYSGQAGYNILSPFITNDFVIMVERGWVPIQYNSPPIKDALPSIDEVVIIGKIYPSQKAATNWTARLLPKDPEGQLKIMAYADIERLSKQVPYKLVDFYLKLEQQIPEQNSQLPLALIPPKLSNGNHLSYALQWFAFVLIGLIGYALIVRKRILKGHN